MSMSMMVKAINAKVGSPMRKLVLIKLADHADDQGSCYPSYQHIADSCEMSRRTVIEHVKKLQEMGIVKVKKRGSENGSSSNVFYLDFSNAESIKSEARPKKKGVQEIHPPSAGAALPPVQEIHPPSAGAAPITSHLISQYNQSCNHGSRDVVFEVLNYLNKRTNSNFTKVDYQSTGNMGKLLTHGYTEQDMIMVIDSKCEDWLTNGDFKNNLTPKTLFSLSNFEGYLSQAKRKKEAALSINEKDVVTAWNSLGQTQHHGITAKAMQEMQNTYTVYKNRMIENGKEFRTIGEWIIAYIKNGFSSYIKRNHRENSSGWRADLEYAVRLSTYEKIINIKE